MVRPNVGRMFIDLNKRASRWLERVLPAGITTDGYRDFNSNFAHRYISGGRILDVGGGKQPFFTPEHKERIGAYVIGLDISADELKRAPVGAYDETIVADICRYHGAANANNVVCQSLLEHVPDLRAAIYGMASILKPEGQVVAFIPCRNAVFARLNLILPEHWKQKILFFFYPEMRRAHGFPAYYNQCTPACVESICKDAGLRLVEMRRYYCSTYFHFFFPLQLLWRLWSLLVYNSGLGECCETFSFVAVKAASHESSTSR
jgi:SAM-dependent methyltransferase